MRESDTLTSLVEVGFISNTQEGRLLTQEDYQNKVAWALYVGILKYLSVQPSGN